MKAMQKMVLDTDYSAVHYCCTLMNTFITIYNNVHLTHSIE